MAHDRTSLLASCVCLALGCASDHLRGEERGEAAAADGSEANSGEGELALEIAFNPMYSAYDGDRHVFQVPVRVLGAQGVLRVRSMPADFVRYEPSEVGVTLTTRRAGRATIFISDGAGNSGSAALTVTEYEPEQVEIGRRQYDSEQRAFPDTAARTLVLPDVASCASCHQPGSSIAMSVLLPGEYTPQQTGGLSDAELARILTEGVKPVGWPFLTVNGGGLVPDAMAARTLASFHQWQLAPETLTGLIAYLRSLAPRSLGTLD
jgi:hypothetical protein